MNPNTRWYLKLAIIGGSIGASMELFMYYTGFYDKVVTLEAQQRLEALQASRDSEGNIGQTTISPKTP
ncbi:hypothetical protein R1flu_005130 [Riccia fluitans]|uniref:Uncharacterized protein n=1 Tax=Riccia fluitans TaxID=41844 RepID=A0ABD1YST7_9MARC